jgi:hypothetical protein
LLVVDLITDRLSEHADLSIKSPQLFTSICRVSEKSPIYLALKDDVASGGQRRATGNATGGFTSGKDRKARCLCAARGAVSALRQCPEYPSEEMRKDGCRPATWQSSTRTGSSADTAPSVVLKDRVATVSAMTSAPLSLGG